MSEFVDLAEGQHILRIHHNNSRNSKEEIGPHSTFPHVLIFVFTHQCLEPDGFSSGQRQLGEETAGAEREAAAIERESADAAGEVCTGVNFR